MNLNTRLFKYIFQFFFCKKFYVSSAECSYLALEETAGLFTHIPGVALFVPPPVPPDLRGCHEFLWELSSFEGVKKKEKNIKHFLPSSV